MKRVVVPIAVWIMSGASSASAHPVSFKGGVGIMPTITRERQELELNYSLTNSHAVGLNNIRVEYEDRDLTFVLPQFSSLRWCLRSRLECF